MEAPIARIDLTDPGPGHRLAEPVRLDLRERLRQASRSGARCVLLTVEADAFDHAPEAARLDSEQFTQPVVAGQVHALVLQLVALPLPVVVRLDGAVSGLGLGLALATDVRVAGPAASFALGPPDSAAALLSGASWLLSWGVGTAVATRLTWTGDALDALAAEQVGLIARLAIDASESERAAEDLAAELAELPVATASALKRLTVRDRVQLAAALDYESWLAGVARPVEHMTSPAGQEAP